MTFEELYHAYYEQIFKFCYRYVGNDEKAGDLTQDTFLKLLQRMRTSSKNIENPKSWLYKVAANLSINSINTNKRREVKAAGIISSETVNSNPESIYISNETQSAVRDIISKLKPEKRTLLLLYQDGLSYKEMSDVTGIPVNSIGKTLWREIANISKMIKTN
jgi:RNA polymerase sigma-70 factor (ECF subfamily)